MCGILGSVDVPFDPDLLDLIGHRGPDGQGIVEVACGVHRVTLGHRRLAIVDLSPSGAQPISTADGKGHLIFNGEIYNHNDLRKKLSGIHFKGHSDTETLLHAMTRFGVDSIPQLNGIFGFAFVDVRQGKLYLVRDPFGVKPVYYSTAPGRFCFASELSPLLRMVPGDIDLDSLADLLKLRFCPSPSTLFKHIRKLKPGHILEVDLNAPQLILTERPYIASLPPINESHQDLGLAVDEYGALFERAVGRQLMADVEIGVLLSGGVDSALVAASVQRQSHKPIKAFTVGFSDDTGADEDEIADAKETADVLGLEHHTAKIGFDDFLATLSDCVGIVEEPLATTSIVPMHYLAQIAGAEVKVVMSGQGADEPLGGYGRYQGELYRGIVTPLVARTGSRLADLLGVRNDTVRRGLAALSHGEDVARFEQAYSVFSDREITRLVGRKSEQAGQRIEDWYRQLGCEALPSSAARMMAIDLRFGLSDDLLLYTDKITMRQSLECRVPILDHDLIAFIESLPPKLRVQRGSTKIIHKAYAEKSLPPAIVHRPKKGFLSPTRTWFRDTDRLREILLDPGSRFASYFDLTAVDDVLVSHQSGYNRERHIFLLLCLSFWFDRYG